MNQEYNDYGARIERGVITRQDDGRYIVKSYDRHGLVTPPIETINAQQFNAGDRVYFFLFDDGTGRIIASMNE